MVGREHEKSFSHMNWHFFESLWDVQEETLQSAMQDLDQKCMHLLMEINVLMFI